MSDMYDRDEMDSNGGGGFMMGLITGAVLGAGIGLLLAPKSGAELRGQLGAKAGNLADAAQDAYRRATNRASDLADRGRDLANDLADRGRDLAQQAYDKGRDVASRAADEAERYTRD